MKLYPERMRCRSCRQFLALRVVDRLYCSYRCAGRIDPDLIRPFPREHVLAFGEPKREFFYPDDPEIRRSIARNDTSASVYRCGHCGMWHIGHKRPEVTA